MSSLVFAVDLLLRLQMLPVVLRGLLDETAHVATALVLWPCSPTAVPPSAPRAVLAGLLLLDLDHVPGAVGIEAIRPGSSRPATHSLVAIGAIAWLLHLRWPTAPEIRRAVALGMALHLVRDMATGGVLLLWPLRAGPIRIPYAVYAGALLVCERRSAQLQPGRQLKHNG